jgi:hypothetical protein
MKNVLFLVAVLSAAIFFFTGCNKEMDVVNVDNQPHTLYAINVDYSTGVGFVGKGDVQLALGLNNKQLQDQAASLEFTFNSEVVSEVSWTCTNSNNENTKVRERTTTITTEGIVSSIAREKNQITGFNLNGFTGTPTTSSTSEGNELNSCPGGPWTLTTHAGAPEVISTDGGLKVNGVDLQ